LSLAISRERFPGRKLQMSAQGRVAQTPERGCPSRSDVCNAKNAINSLHTDMAGGDDIHRADHGLKRPSGSERK
jgi:hypothetical protein